MRASRAELLKEAGRKAFHLLTLAYLAAYLWLPGVVFWMGLWTALVVIVELGRLRLPALNRALTEPFLGIMREEESRGVSGIFHTTLGGWLVMVLWGSRPAVVVGALLNLAFGDAAAALAGKAFGRHRFTWRGKTKSLEGSLACFGVCAAAGACAGLPFHAAAAGALAAAVVEALPLGIDDNALVPLASGAALAAALK